MIKTDTTEKIMQEYHIGHSVFKKLAKLNDKKLKEKIISIIGNEIYIKDILGDSCSIIRTIVNEIYSKIEIRFYDTILINSFGIFYDPEYGPFRRIIKFDKYFKL